MERRSKFLTFVLALIPGAGHMYLGQINKGIQLLALFVIINPALNLVGLGFLGDIVRLILWCYAFFDTFDLARRVDRGEQIKDGDFLVFKYMNSYMNNDKSGDFPLKEHFRYNKNWLLWGWGLIIFGVLAIFNRTFWNNEFYGLIKSFVSMYFIPILLIAAGAYMLIRNKNN